ncbi:MAG: LemA family protein [Candidatus Micrarchaeota archaeon]|nr:LemA family protein [Candidatus Micrarchaeota archaeon]
MVLLITALEIILVVLAGVLVIIYNTLVSLRNNVSKAWANIDVLLEKRHDLIGRLVETVKGYMNYERSLLVQITAMRTSWSNVQQDRDPQNKMKASNQITAALKTVIANRENYPDLKTDNTFIELMQALTEIEDQIADRREFYNDTVNIYNTKIKVIPYNLLSGALHYAPLQYFSAPDQDRKQVDVDLGR